MKQYLKTHKKNKIEIFNKKIIENEKELKRAVY